MKNNIQSTENKPASGDVPENPIIIHVSQKQEKYWQFCLELVSL